MTKNARRFLVFLIGPFAAAFTSFTFSDPILAASKTKVAKSHCVRSLEYSTAPGLLTPAYLVPLELQTIEQDIRDGYKKITGEDFFATISLGENSYRNIIFIQDHAQPPSRPKPTYSFFIDVQNEVDAIAVFQEIYVKLRLELGYSIEPINFSLPFQSLESDGLEATLLKADGAFDVLAAEHKKYQNMVAFLDVVRSKNSRVLMVYWRRGRGEDVHLQTLLRVLQKYFALTQTL